MKNFRLFLCSEKCLILLVLGCIGPLSAAFEIKELNLQDKVELDGVCALFDDLDNRKQTTADADEVRRLVYLQQNKTFISKTKSTPAVITGMLMCQYARNELDPSRGYYNFLDWDCFLSGKYKKTEYDAINYGTIVIHPCYRRQGVACALMNKAEQFGIDNGVCNVVLSVFKSNQKAIDCYKKQGFEILSELDRSVTKKLYKKLTLPKKECLFDDQANLLLLVSSFHE